MGSCCTSFNGIIHLLQFQHLHSVEKLSSCFRIWRTDGRYLGNSISCGRVKLLSLPLKISYYRNFPELPSNLMSFLWIQISLNNMQKVACENAIKISDISRYLQIVTIQISSIGSVWDISFSISISISFSVGDIFGGTYLFC